MNYIWIRNTIVTILLCLTTNSFAQDSFPLYTSFYNLDLSFDFNQDMMKGICKMKIVNQSSKTVNQLPIILYRLMKVKSVKNANGVDLHFSQKVDQFTDFPELQVNTLLIKEKFLPHQTRNIVITYDGYLLGYQETGTNYIRDKISSEFTIIRNDAFTYPIIAKPQTSFLRKNIALHNFDYKIRVSVPDSLVVANGGILKSIVREKGISVFEYTSKKPNWRIDIAISAYKKLNNEGFGIFYFEKDSTYASNISKIEIKTIKLYKEWWGELKSNNTLSIIETEKETGGQADETTILLPQEAFTENGSYMNLYHELSHLWNVRINENKGLSPRWEEGLATFCQYIAEEKLNSEKELSTKRITDQYIKRLKTDFERNPNLLRVPIIDFGNENLTNYSYTQGMLMFSVLYYWVGESNFNQVIKNFYQHYYSTGASTLDFTKLWEKSIPNENLNQFFDDWMYGTKYTEFITKDMSVDYIIAHYKQLGQSR